MRRLWAGIAVLAFTSLTAFPLSNEALAAPWAPAAPTSLPPNCAPAGGELPNLCPSTPTDVSDGRFAPRRSTRRSTHRREPGPAMAS
jgi:hypothetical protein